MGQLHGGLGGGDPYIEVGGGVVAPPGAEGEGRNAQTEVIQQLAHLPQPRPGERLGVDLAPGVDFHRLGPQLRRGVQRFFER